MKFWSAFLSSCHIDRTAVNDLIQTKVIESTFKHYLLAHHGRASDENPAPAKSKVQNCHLFTSVHFYPFTTITRPLNPYHNIILIGDTFYNLLLASWLHNSRQLGHRGLENVFQGNICQTLRVVLLLGFCWRLFQNVARPITDSYAYCISLLVHTVLYTVQYYTRILDYEYSHFIYQYL